MLSRRRFLNIATKTGIAAASAPLWLDQTSVRAFAQMSGTYKAIVVVTLIGGNDGNNSIIPLDTSSYGEYAAIRAGLALPMGSCIPLSKGSGSGIFGLHPSLVNTAALYNGGRALAVANVGPLAAPTTKAQFRANPSLLPQALESHPANQAQWESATSLALPATGWGGRMADLLQSQSGSLPPVLDAGGASIFTVGQSVQGIAIPVGTTKMVPLPSGINSAILAIAENDSSAENLLVAQAAQLRAKSIGQQALIAQAQSSGTPLTTVFPATGFGQTMKAIASVIKGRDVLGASRQIFYAQQGNYDNHAAQLNAHAACLTEFDGGVGAFFAALQEMGLQDDVLICTLSDFNRSMLGNVSGGTDHAWGNHQFIIGGGIKGGRIIGTVPEPELGGSLDVTTNGTWIPTLSVTQMTASIGSWMGLSSSQLATVFPDLANFSDGPIALT
jgi:uncharacterized protein (DUF1501 family)